MSDDSKVPQHVGYILDGNRRWAKKYGLPTYEGHLAGYEALKEVIDATADAGVKYISFYSWSTENWARAEEEVRGIMKIVRQLFKADIKQLMGKGYKFVVLGGRERVPEDIIKMIDEAEATSASGTRATLAMCFNYGGQQEIIRATQRYVRDLLQGASLTQDHSAKGSHPFVGEVGAGELSAGEFAQYLDHPEIPACDLIVRTSGEQRLSNFMLWRSAYSEFIFLEKFWPEMRKEDVTGIIEEYTRRSRRYGV